jgi:hypothetical protein
MDKKNRRRKREKWQKVRPDESFRAGPLRIARYGRYVSFENNATPEQHAEFLRHTAQANQDIVQKLGAEIASLQSDVRTYDPIELMHRAAYMLLPLFLKYYSENQYSSEETLVLPAVEYLQYLISRTPPNDDTRAIDESRWNMLWEQLIKILYLTQNYILTRSTLTNPHRCT